MYNFIKPDNYFYCKSFSNVPSIEKKKREEEATLIIILYQLPSIYANNVGNFYNIFMQTYILSSTKPLLT